MQRVPLYVLMVFASAVLLLMLAGETEGKITTVDDSGGADYSNIQDAVDAAQEGDIIRVFDGTYNEVVWINITLDLIGNGSLYTIIDGTGLVGLAETGPSLVIIQADGCNISSFRMTNITNFMCAGIEIRSDNNWIFNNNCSHNDYGILIKDSEDNVIEMNSIYSNKEAGIGIDTNSINNSIHFNDIRNTGEYGIEVMDNSSLVTNATNNWWGDDTGPYHPSRNPDGKGDNVSDSVEFDPWIGKEDTTKFYGSILEKDTDLPIMNAVVHISNGDSIIYTAYTDENGYYEREVEPGNYTLTADKEGYSWFWELEIVMISEGESKEYTMELMKDQEASSVELTSSESRIALDDKDVTIVAITVMNTGEFNDTYTLAIGGNYSGWKVSLDAIGNISLQPGAYRIFFLSVVKDTGDSQNGEDKTENITVTITATSVIHGEVQDSVTIEGRLESGDDRFEVPYVPPAAIGLGFAAGGMVSVFAALRFYEPGRFKLFSLFIFLYSRIRKDTVEDSVPRGMIVGYLAMNPGSHYNTLKRDLGFGNNKLTYHLDVLGKSNTIKSRKDGRLLRYYPKRYKIPEVEGEMKRLSEILLEVPRLNRKQIAKIMQVSPNTVSKLVDALIEKGKIRYEMRGKEKLYSVIEPVSSFHEQSITHEMRSGEHL